MTTARTLFCPVCDVTAETTRAGSVEYDRCETCGGVWLDRGELEQLLAMAYAKGKARTGGASLDRRVSALGRLR